MTGRALAAAATHLQHHTHYDIMRPHQTPHKRVIYERYVHLHFTVSRHSTENRLPGGVLQHLPLEGHYSQVPRVRSGTRLEGT